MNRLFLFLITTTLFLGGCVSKKKFTAAEAEAEKQAVMLRTDLGDCKDQLNDTQGALRAAEDQLAKVSGQLDAERSKNEGLMAENQYLKETNSNLLLRLEDLSIVSKSGAESIRQSLETINRQNEYVQDLTSSIQRKDSLNLALVMKLKRSLGDVNDEDVQVEVKKGVVYISLSDKMLFKTGSAEIQTRADEVLGKIAKVVNDHKDFDILVEGHTDDVPISNTCMQDNWDLSVKRATSVVRRLQTKYSVMPERMTAGGRGEYLPKADNETTQGRSLNRRTEIIILPKLDEFFSLLADDEAGE